MQPCHERMIDLYCLGGASVDLILEAPRLPLAGEKLLAHYYGQLPGGFIANTACAAAKLGLRTAWAGSVGDDAFGHSIMQGFTKFGVRTDDVELLKDAASDFTVVLVHPDGERTILIVPSLPIPPALDEHIRCSLQNSRIGYTVLYDHDWFMEVADLLHGSGGKVAVDLELNTLRDREAASQMLKAADYVFSDKNALRELTGNADENESVKEILALGAELVILTKGSEGAAAYTATGRYSTGSYQVPIKDTTGAGDCFHAAVLFGILSDFQYQDCLDFASAAAAILIQEMGARQGLPTAVEVQKFMENHIRGDELK